MFKDYEVWIVDNESTDGTLPYLKTLESPFYWIREKDNGIYDAMNKGISLAKKEWIYFLGADDAFYNEQVLQNIFTSILPTEVELIIGYVKYDLKKGDKVYTNGGLGLVKPSWSLKLWIKNSLHHQALFYKKALFATERYDPKYKRLADYAFNLALYKKKIQVKMIDDIIALCGARGSSKIYDFEMYVEEVQLKTDKSTLLLKPLFYANSLLKFIFKKFMKGT